MRFLLEKSTISLAEAVAGGFGSGEVDLDSLFAKIFSHSVFEL